MKILKPVLYTAFAGVVFTSCKSIAKIPVPKGADTVINIPAKKNSLSVLEKQRWGHLDLATDSIPGMSLDKAYKFVEGKKIEVFDFSIENKNHPDVLFANHVCDLVSSTVSSLLPRFFTNTMTAKSN